MGRAQHRGRHAHQVGQERIAAAADQEPRDQRVGERQDQAGQHRDARQPGGPVGERVEQLAPPLEGEERLARHGEGEHVGLGQAPCCEHDLAQPEVAGEVAVAVDQPVAEADRDDHGPDDEDDVEQRRAWLGRSSEDPEGAHPAAVLGILGKGGRQDALLVADPDEQGHEPEREHGGEGEREVAEQDAGVDQQVDRVDRVPGQAIGPGGDQSSRLRLDAEGTAQVPERPEAQHGAHQPEHRARGPERRVGGGPEPIRVEPGRDQDEHHDDEAVGVGDRAGIQPGAPAWARPRAGS